MKTPLLALCGALLVTPVSARAADLWGCLKTALFKDPGAAAKRLEQLQELAKSCSSSPKEVEITIAKKLGAAIALFDPNALRALHGRTMLQTQSWSIRDLEAVCTLAEAFYALDRAGVRTPLFPHELCYAMFFDNSTRTKSSWAGASARLGAH